MNLRPRCREWLPLATQQLRLRNLTRIQGLNIECGVNTGVDSYEVYIYYTLHADKASEAFYTSEALPQCHQLQKWAEICAGDVWRKSNAQCVCVKVWSRSEPTKRMPGLSEIKESIASTTLTLGPQSALTQRMAYVCHTPQKLPRPPELLFTWGVYFSGLIPLAPITRSSCRPNCLIFQLNDENFTSPVLIGPEGLHAQLHVNYQSYAANATIDNNIHAVNDADVGINSPQVSRSSSPVVGQPEREVLRMTTKRYTLLCCNKGDIRASYNLEKLLELQRIQRLRQQKERESRVISVDIARLSMQCITRNELRYKPRTTSISGTSYAAQHLNHSMGRTLSVLLAEQNQIAPLTLYTAQQLTEQIEALRCKTRLLQAERETFLSRNAGKKEHLKQLQQQRTLLQQQLKLQQTQLEQQRNELETKLEQHKQQQDFKRQIVRQMERRITTLVMELQEVYNIRSLEVGQSGICGIPFPNMEQYASNERQTGNAQLLEHVSPLAMSAALGYVAHLVQMLAIIMDRPLRNPIIYEPSRTRISDVIKKPTTATHHFPLYTRSILPAEQTKYAIYLLRQNIAQLCYDIIGRCDLRNTFGSLLEMFDTLRHIERSQRDQSTEPVAAHCDELDATNCTPLPHINGLTTAVANQQLSQSHSSVDMNHVPMPTTAATAKDALLQLLPPGVSQALAIEGYSSTQRICRSVGSYSDGEDDFRPTLEHTYSNSDSNIALQSERS